MAGGSSNSDIASAGLAFIGFGEAAAAFARGWAGAGIPLDKVSAYDVKTDDLSADVIASKRADYERAGISGADRLADALHGAATVFSLVTADQAFVAAQSAAEHLLPGTLYFDCNSCAPGTKCRAAEIIEQAGGRYVDVAVMSPVHPALHHTPLLLGGRHADDALTVFDALDMKAKIMPGDVGKASSIKMLRSVMIKGLEALVLECVLAGRKAGVDDIVLDSLDATFPGFDWKKRAAYMMERVMTHGVRRAAEMREVALTVRELGLSGAMSEATVVWDQEIGELGLKVATDDYAVLADALLKRMNHKEEIV
ncbi:MAG: DUF1932 domain-containing protein [Fimbriimonadaceae bacterium]|nr:DUF1932 domain-containing protein [Alphaproteobacteria bacterium]